MELHRGKLKSEDPLVKRIVVDWIQSNRSKLIANRLSKPFTYPSEGIVQDLGALELEKVEVNELGLSMGNFLQRTKKDLPLPIFRKDGMGIFTYIGPASLDSPGYTFLPQQIAVRKGNSTFNLHRVHAFLLGNKIYLHSKGGDHLFVDYINVRGVFQDPITVALFVNPSWTYDDNYAIDKQIIDDLKMLVIQEKFNFIMAPLTDVREGDEDIVSSDIRGVVPTQPKSKTAQ